MRVPPLRTSAVSMKAVGYSGRVVLGRAGAVCLGDVDLADGVQRSLHII